MTKIKRDLNELIVELKEQIGLLEEAIDKVNSGDHKYSKSLSAILRILVMETKTNKPLLFKIAKHFNYEPTVTIDSPFGIKTKALKIHLKDIYFASGTEKLSLTNEEFIKIAAQQDGGAHVDSEIDFSYHFSNRGISIGGLPPKVLKLRILSSHVLKTAKDLLLVINSKNN